MGSVTGILATKVPHVPNVVAPLQKVHWTLHLVYILALVVIVFLLLKVAGSAWWHLIPVFILGAIATSVFSQVSGITGKVANGVPIAGTGVTAGAVAVFVVLIGLIVVMSRKG